MKNLMQWLFIMMPLCALPLSGQTHAATLSWTASTATGLASYNVYRAPCTGTISAGVCSVEGPFVKIGSTASGAITTYVDSTVSAGGLYSFYVTAQCPAAGCSASVGGESVPSNHFANTVPQNNPPPPSGLGITSVSMNYDGSNTTFSAAWTDAPSVVTDYKLSRGNTVLISGTGGDITGSYRVNWTGKVKPGSILIFTVCDTTGACKSRLL